MPDVFFNGCVITVGGDFKPGDQAPTGYLDWHEWADVQSKAGLKQKPCGRCGKWRFPQELSGFVDRTTMQSRKGQVVISSVVCNKCSTLACPPNPQARDGSNGLNFSKNDAP